MLYKVDYTRWSDKSEHTKFVNHAADKVEAVRRFMDWFFRAHPGEKVNPHDLTEISLTGDLSQVDLIDEAEGGQVG